MKKNFKLALDLILVEFDNDKKKVKDGKAQHIVLDTLENLGIDYSQDIKRVHWSESTLYDDLIELMQEKQMQEKVVKALIDKKLITKENIYGIELSLMVWNVQGNKYEEWGDSWVNANSEVDLYQLVGVDKPQWLKQQEEEREKEMNENCWFDLDEEDKPDTTLDVNLKDHNED